MKEQNICKFNPTASNDMVCNKFVFESNKAQNDICKADSHCIHIVTKGSGILVLGTQSLDISEGDIFFVKKGDVYSIDGEGELEYMYISFYGRRADEYIERLGIDNAKNVFSGHAGLIDFWKSSLERADERNIDLLSEAVLLYSLAELTPERREQSDIVTRVVMLTNDSFTDPELTLTLVAERLGYHPKYISTLFKKQKGITYVEYLRELRIKHAVFLMEQGVVSVKNVALLSGFNDPLYFSKVFTAQMGISPKAYIARVSENS